MLRPMSLNPSEGIALYTDGSAYYKDRTGGWAWVAADAFGNEEHDADAQGDTTNNQMEMQAVIEGLYALYLRYGPCDVLVRSDSEYVVLGASNPLRSRRKNREYWDGIDSSIRLHNSIEFEWLRGHKGDHYNEIADDLAGRARKGLL